MKNCKVVNGQLRCEEDSITNLTEGNTQTTEFSNYRVWNGFQGAASPINKRARGALPSNNTQILHDAYDEFIKPKLTEKQHHNLHPVFHHFKTRANTNKISTKSRERAILTKSALKYYETKQSKAKVNEFLSKMGMNDKYTVDFSLSNDDGLVVIDHKTNKAIMVLRGSDKPWKTPSDWTENTQNFLLERNDPMNTNYGKRLNSWYDLVSSEYDVEHISGYSKGGFGAISLGDAKGIPTTTFAPAIALSNLKTTSNVRHEINNTSEDFASVLAEPMKLKNENVTVNTLHPLKKYDTLNPDDTHKINNYYETDARRGNHIEELTHKYLNSKVKLDELNMNARAKNAINRKIRFTEFVRSENPKLVNNIDDTIKLTHRNSALQRAWHNNEGGFSLVESQQLTSLPEAEITRFNTTQSELNDFNDRTPQEQAKIRIQLETETKAHEEAIDRRLALKTLLQDN